MPDDIILPMAALALWTVMVLDVVPLKRVAAARAGRVHVKDFRYGESANMPGDVALPNRDYMNLLELPVLFYAVCLIALVSHRIDPAMVTLAWAFVAARVMHSLIHLTYNNVLHRLAAFSIGLLILAALWVHQVVWVLGKA